MPCLPSHSPTIKRGVILNTIPRVFTPPAWDDCVLAVKQSGHRFVANFHCQERLPKGRQAVQSPWLVLGQFSKVNLRFVRVQSQFVHGKIPKIIRTQMGVCKLYIHLGYLHLWRPTNPHQSPDSLDLPG